MSADSPLPLTAEEEADLRAAGDWCVRCDEYRNPTVPRLLATIDALRAMAEAVGEGTTWNAAEVAKIVEETRSDAMAEAVGEAPSPVLASLVGADAALRDMIDTVAFLSSVAASGERLDEHDVARVRAAIDKARAALSGASS